jgi:hypothetical protein
MSEERECDLFVEEDSDGQERPSDLQYRLNALTELREFEKEGHHAHALEEAIDPTEDKVIAHEIEELGKAPCKNPDDWSHRNRRYHKTRDALRLLYPSGIV